MKVKKYFSYIDEKIFIYATDKKGDLNERGNTELINLLSFRNRKMH